MWLPARGSGAAEIALLDEWRAPEIGGTQFKRLLAAGITTDAPTRRKFEDRFVSLLRGREVALGTPGRVRAYVEASVGRPPVKASRYGVEVTLWSVATGERVWAVRTGENKIGNLRKEAGSLVEDVINDLIHARLL